MKQTFAEPKQPPQDSYSEHDGESEPENDLPEPPLRPATTKVQLTSLPGNRFRMLLPPAEFTLGTWVRLLFLRGWSYFLFSNAWRLAATEPKAALVLTLLQAPFYLPLALNLLWKIAGRVEVTADRANLIHRRRLYCLRWSRSFPIKRIDGLYYRYIARVFGEKDDCSLFLVFTDEKKKLLAAGQRKEDQAWASGELMSFLNSVKDEKTA